MYYINPSQKKNANISLSSMRSSRDALWHDLVGRYVLNALHDSQLRHTVVQVALVYMSGPLCAEGCERVAVAG